MQMEQLYLTILNNLCDGVYFVDLTRKILFWNKGAEEITGYTSEEIVGKSCQDSQLNHIDDEGRPLCVVGCPLFATMIDGKQRKERVFVRHKEGHRIPILVNIFPVVENGEITGAIEIFTQDSPIVYEDNLVEHLSGIAMHDALTNLPNRRYLESFLKYKLDSYNRFNKLFAVLFADIDNFTHFNTTYGHDSGDKILANIAATLRKSVRKDDLIGRWGGEEFLGIYTLSKPFDAPILGEKFRQLVSNTEILYHGEPLNVMVSVGVTVVHPSDNVASIIDRADHLMYQSKKNGKNRVSAD